MPIDYERFRVPDGKKLDLRKWPTRIDLLCDTKEQYKRQLAEQVEELCERQEKLYAHDRYSLLVIFQAMDAAGKDGAIKAVFSGVNPQGCQVFSFKHPSAEELDHDFLWRSTRCLPERGRIGVFNRSYYEEVLIVRVHPEILRAQALPPEVRDSPGIWAQRHQSIRDLETHLHRNGTRIVKFFLHLSKEEQRERFLKRIEEPSKNWKFSSADLKERGFWKEYRQAYEDCLPATSTKEAPWFAIPADDKGTARLLIAATLNGVLSDLDLRFPDASPEHRRDLARCRKLLEADA